MLRREETVLETVERLTGAALDRFLNKWVRWIKGMIPPGADPAQYVGEPKVTPSTVIKLFKEYCPDLTQGECYDKLVEVFLYSRATGKTVFDPVFIKSFERKAAISSTISKILNLDWEVNPSVAEDLYKAIFEQRNVEQACELIKYDITIRWVSLGEDPPQEELEVAARVCDRIKELVARRAPPAEWWKVLEPVYRTREEMDPSIKPYIAKVKFWGIDKDVEYILKEAKPEDLVIMTEEAIERDLGLKVVYREDLKPTDLIDKQALEEMLGRPVKIYSATQASQADELWYVNKFVKGRVEVPIMCIYYQEADYIVACDRPATTIKYNTYVRVAPIPLAKQVKILYKKGILVEEKR